MADNIQLTPLSSAILFALADGASHGYAIIKEIEELTDGQMKPRTGSMYLALHRLLEDGLIAESPMKTDDARRRYYKLTEAGREAARGEAARLAQLVRIASAKRLIPRGAV
jgi:DNA-binding PadR family transcriptional regulator